MKFLLSENNTDGLRVRMDGPEEEQWRIANLAENMYGVRNYDTFAGRVISFDSMRQFKRLLGWRAIFNRHSTKNTFHFVPLARKAVKEVRAILEKDVRRIDFKLDDLFESR